MKTVARRNFQLARNLADRQEFHAAIQLLEQAVEDRLRKANISRCSQSVRPTIRGGSTERYRTYVAKAVAMRPDDGALAPCASASLLERQGRYGSSSREQYEVALEKGPEVIAAREALERLRSRSGAKAVEKKGLLQTIRALFNRGTRA